MDIIELGLGRWEKVVEIFREGCGDIECNISLIFDLFFYVESCFVMKRLPLGVSKLSLAGDEANVSFPRT